MSGRPRLSARAARGYSREHRLDLKAHVLERGGQEQVVLEAVPAPSAGHELVLQIGLLQGDRDAAVGVEVLERNPRRVRAVNCLPGRFVRRVQADPAEVSVEVEHQNES
jgi:hypothetical protein